MKAWFISDTHNRHRGLEIPADVSAVFHCGDESHLGSPLRNQPECRAFFEWYTSLPIEHKFFVPGNHSTAFGQGLVTPDEYPSVRFLVHAGCEWEGLKIFGTPYTPLFFNWAYMKPRPELDAVWQTIPDDTDILLSHGPPKGILDVTRDWRTRAPIHVGSRSLTRHVLERIQPKLHAFGHIHDEPEIDNFGIVDQQGIRFINCSCCDLSGKLKNHGIVVDLEELKSTRTDSGAASLD
jgi:hypothetical protein